MKIRFNRWTLLMLLVTMLGFVGMGTLPAWANTPQASQASQASQVSAITGSCLTSSSVCTAGADAQIQQTSSPPAQPFPAGAWVLESVGAVVAGAGFIMIGTAMSFVTQRTILVNKASDPATRVDNIALARDIRSLEDTGTGLYIAGFVAAGVGLVGMVAGAIWLLTHRSTPPTLPVASSGADKTQIRILPVPSDQHTFLIRDGY